MNRCVLSVSRCLVPAFVTACWATASLAQQGPPTVGVNVLNTPRVQIVNPPNAPAANFIVNPGDLAHALGVQSPITIPFTWDIKTQGIMKAQYTVPTGKRLIIHTVSGNCNSVNANVGGLAIGVITPGLSVPVPMIWVLDMPLTPTNQNTSGTPVFNVLADASFDAGTQFDITFNQASTAGGPNVFLSCKMNAFGQLLDVP